MTAIHRAQAELHRLKAVFHKSTGITGEKLARIGGTSNGKETADLHAEVVKVRQERDRKAV